MKIKIIKCDEQPKYIGLIAEFPVTHKKKYKFYNLNLSKYGFGTAWFKGEELRFIHNKQ